MRVPIPERLQWHRPTLFGWFQCSLMAYFLWSLFWVQFLTKFCFGWPFSSFSHASLGMYAQTPGYPWSLAELYFGVSVVAGIVTMISAVVVTEKARAKWRLRVMVAIFAFFPIGFAYLQFPMKERQVMESRMKLESLEELGERSPEDRQWFGPKVEDLRSLIEEVE